MKNVWVIMFAAVLVAFPAVAGTDTDISGYVTVDTRDSGVRPVIGDVTSDYCGRLQHVYFLEGVSLNVEFEVDVNWNGKTPDKLRFNEAGTEFFPEFAGSRS